MGRRSKIFRKLGLLAAVLLLTGTNLFTQQGAMPQKGGQEQTGHYQAVPNWPQPLPDSEGKWTWGATQGIFAQNPNRIFILQRGELPLLKRPAMAPIPQFGPSLAFPVNQMPFRNASQSPVASPPSEYANKGLIKDGVDYRWRNVLFVVDGEGKLVEAWNQWDSLFRKPHSVYVSPYDPEKHVWVVDDTRHQIFKFTNDGKKLVLTLGEKDVPGNDEKHFDGPTFLTWLPDGTMFLADGYQNTRVVKMDKNGKFLMSWGKKGEPGGNEKRPGYFNTVHGIGVDARRRVYVNDRANRRIQVFDENGKYLDEWSTGNPPSQIYVIHMAPDGIWGADAATWKMIKWNFNGEYQYSWGYQGDAPGGFFAVHGISVDQEGNLYVAEVSGGRAQKFIPRKGADPAKLLGKPVYAAWRE